MTTLTYKIIEGLFTLIVVGFFGFFVIARVKKKTLSEYFNEVLDSIFGKTDYLNIKPKVPFKNTIQINKKTIR